MLEKRLVKAMAQYARQIGSEEFLPTTIEWLPKILNTCGPTSQHRKMALKIAQSILLNREVRVIAPCCPDYSYSNEVYDFKSLNCEVSLLAKKQIEFLIGLQKQGIPVKAILLYADQEACDDQLLRLANGEKNLFIARVKQSVESTKLLLRDTSWQASLMTDFLPSFFSEEETLGDELKSRSELSARISSDTLQRLDMYRRINPCIQTAEAIERTIRTATHYLILGNYAVTHNYLISNHTTTNLAWYGDTGVGILHNPIAVY